MRIEISNRRTGLPSEARLAPRSRVHDQAVDGMFEGRTGSTAHRRVRP